MEWIIIVLLMCIAVLLIVCYSLLARLEEAEDMAREMRSKWHLERIKRIKERAKQSEEQSKHQ